MPRMAHDLFVGHAVAIGGSHEAGPQSVWADRLSPGAWNSGLTCTTDQDLTHGASCQPRLLDLAAAVNFSENRAIGDPSLA